MSTTSIRSLRALALCLCFMLVVAPVMRAEAMVIARSGAIHTVVNYGVLPEPGANVSVTVVNLDTAEVAATATTDESGAATLADLPLGTYYVQVTPPEGFVASNGPLVTITANSGTPNVSFTLTPSGAQDGGALQDVIASASDETIVTGNGATLNISGATMTGDHTDAAAIQAALDGGANVCAEFDGAQQPDGSWNVTGMNAFSCDDDQAAAFLVAGAVLVGGGSAEVGGTALLLLGLLGAGAFAVGVAGVTNQDDDIPDTVTQ